MTLDPAFGLLVCGPILIAALAAVLAARPSRIAAAVIAVCGVLAFVAGCGGPVDRGDGVTGLAARPASSAPPVRETPPARETPPPQPSARSRAFTPAELAAARHAKAGGIVSVDVLDTRPGGTRHDALTIAPNDTLHVVGWAFAETVNAPCDVVGLVIDGKQVVPAQYGYARSDVAAFYKDPSRTNVGYSVEVPAARLGRGEHPVTVVCIARGAVATGVSGRLRVTVR